MVDTTSRSVRRTRSLQCQRSLIVAGDGATPSRHLLNYPRLRCLLLLVGPVPHLIFRKLPLDNFPHSAKYPCHITSAQRHVALLHIIIMRLHQIIHSQCNNHNKTQKEYEDHNAFITAQNSPSIVVYFCTMKSKQIATLIPSALRSP